MTRCDEDIIKPRAVVIITIGGLRCSNNIGSVVKTMTLNRSVKQCRIYDNAENEKVLSALSLL